MRITEKEPSRNGNSQCKGPEAGVCLAGLRHSKDTSIGWSGMSKVGSDRQDGRGSQG